MKTTHWILAALAGPSFGITVHIITAGCGGSAVQQRPTGFTLTPQQGVVATDRVAIAAENGSFVLEPQRLFPTPFSSHCPIQPTTDNYPDAEVAGALRVRVSYPGLTDPLYGVLAFCKIDQNFRGSASRSYRVEVPQSYVDATANGNMSVVFEVYDVAQGGPSYPAWILWLSREPIPSRTPTGAPLAGGAVAGGERSSGGVAGGSD